MITLTVRELQCFTDIENVYFDSYVLYLPALPKAKAGLGVQSLRPPVRPSQNLVIETPLKLLVQLS